MIKGLKLKEIESIAGKMDIEAALDYLESIKKDYGSSLDKLTVRYRKKKDELDKELQRFKEMSIYEEEAINKGYRFIAGIDEAGRGPLAGPVVAAAVILPQNEVIHGVNDSKQLTAAKREQLYEVIREKALAWGVGIADERCIDDINILNATRLAMKAAVQALKPKPDLLLIDAEKVSGLDITQVSIVKGDCLSVSIAAASIIAKVTRDRMLEEIDRTYPQYGFSRHKGYGTKEHIQAIKKFGICPIHRISFTKNFTG